jgi:thiol-disulfide isomerase/thioredoxin|tara:strand:+ start:1017 stop:1643 length:627 start_codon:yes stop_codon:yes gene_type:complete
MSLSEEKFSQGMSTEEYFGQTKVNRQPLIDIYRAVATPAETRSFFDGLAQPLRLAVFTADWCGDAVSTTPAILRLAESTDNLWVRVFNRDEELALTNSFLPESRAGTVPVFVVLDRSMGEVARFIETANELVPAIDAMDEMIAAEVAGEAPETARTLVRGKRTAYRVAHAKEWGEVILGAFQRVVAGGLALPANRRPAVGGTKWPPEN